MTDNATKRWESISSRNFSLFQGLTLNVEDARHKAYR
jgi:hypothetical protein